MNQYCRPYYEFSLFDEFKPGEFKIIDFLEENTSHFLREHTNQGEELSHSFLDALRWVDVCMDDGYMHKTKFAYIQETAWGFFSDKDQANKFIELLEDIGDEELKEIIKILKEHNFIRTDNFHRSFLINFLPTGIIINNPLYDLNDIVIERWDLYETIKPINNVELEKIFEILHSFLSPNQYEIIKFYILNANRIYFYTDMETNAIHSAFRNIFRARDTLFS